MRKVNLWNRLFHLKLAPLHCINARVDEEFTYNVIWLRPYGKLIILKQKNVETSI